MCSISGTCEPAVTKFASWEHLTWMQSNLGFDLLFRVTWGQNVRIKCLDNRMAQVVVVTAVHRDL